MPDPHPPRLSPEPAPTKPPTVPVTASPSRWRRLSWPVVGLAACILGLVAALIVMVAGGGGPLPDDPSANDAYEQGYQDGLEDAQSGYYDYGYGPGMPAGMDPFDPDDQPDIIALLVQESGIEQLTDLCLDMGFAGLTIGGSSADNPDTIDYWIYDGYEPWVLGSKPEVSDVRFGPDEYELAPYLDHGEVVADDQGLSDSDLGMVCITTENGDDVPRAAYYFLDSIKGTYNPVVYVDLQTLAVVD